MTDPIPQVYLDEAAIRAGYESWQQAYHRAAAAARTSIRAHARTLQELGWQPPVDPMLVRAREICSRVSREIGWHDCVEPYLSGEKDKSGAVEAVLIALREGMGK